MCDVVSTVCAAEISAKVYLATDPQWSCSCKVCGGQRSKNGDFYHWTPVSHICLFYLSETL